MLILTGIVLVCAVTAAVLFKDLVGGILAWKLHTNPRWVGAAVKSTLSLIATVLVVLGTICLGITMVAFAIPKK